MECLKDYIGLIEISTAEGASELRLIDLPGIFLDKINDAKVGDEDLTEYWDKIQKRALGKLATKSMSLLNECYKITDPEIVSCLVCEKKVLFGNALWYLLGAEFMIDLLYSSNVNRWTTIDKEQAAELKDFYQVLYESEIANAVKGVSPEDSDCMEEGCVECSGPVRFVEVLP